MTLDTKSEHEVSDQVTLDTKSEDKESDQVTLDTKSEDKELDQVKLDTKSEHKDSGQITPEPKSEDEDSDQETLDTKSEHDDSDQLTSERESLDSSLSHGSYEKGAYQYTKRQGVPLSGHKEQTYVKKTRFERDQHKSSATSDEFDLPKIERISKLKRKVMEDPENGSSETSNSAVMYNL